MTRCGVLIALAPFASMGVSAFCRPPRQIVVEVSTALAVQSLGVVVANAASMNHVFRSGHFSFYGSTLGGVAIAEAVPTDDHVKEGVVVLLRHLLSGVQQVVTQFVELNKLYSEVSDFQHVLYS